MKYGVSLALNKKKMNISMKSEQINQNVKQTTE